MSSTSVTAPERAPLLIVCDWIPPEFGAVGQYEVSRARGIAESGRHVVLIGLGRQAGRERENVGAGTLDIVRVSGVRPDKANFLARISWTFAINNALMSCLMGFAEDKPECEIRVTGSPPFLSYLVLFWGTIISRRRRSIIYRITDFYPETAFAAGKARALRLIAPFIHALRKRAARIEVLSECQRRRLNECGVDNARMELVRDASPVAFGPHVRPAERPFSDGETILLYSGNLGVAHDWRSFAEAYRRHVHEGTNRVRLWLNAGGVNVPALRSYCAIHDLPVHVSAPVPLDALAGVLLAADAHLILLGDPFWGYVFPSKTYACIDSGRPCLYLGPVESDVHTLLSEAPKHASIRQGDVEAAVAALERLATVAVNRRPALA